MSWRTAVISERCKLDYKMGYMVVRSEETKRLFLDEVAMLIIENTAVSLTCCLLEELVKRKIKVIFCDAQRNPHSELVPMYGSHDCSLKLKMQLGWSDGIKGDVWTEIVAEKIRNQAMLLGEIGKSAEAEMLRGYLTELEFNDATNREGHAAKVYFNAVFGMEFTRGDAENPINAALNYGYSLILSAVNREIAANGYLTQIGLFHDNQFNQFNLGCDLMEPFRVNVDAFVRKNEYSVFGKDEKHALLEVLHENVLIDGTNQTTLNAIKIYCRSVFAALNDRDTSLIKFVRRKA